MAVLLRPARLVRSILHRPARVEPCGDLQPTDRFFTAILEFPGEPPRYEQLDLPLETARAPRTIHRPSAHGHSRETFTLVDTRAWPTVARYALVGAASTSVDDLSRHGIRSR